MSATRALATAPDPIVDEPVPASIADANVATAEPVLAEANSPTTTEGPVLQQPATTSVAPAEPKPSPSDHELVIQRIRQSTLPPALRERLAAAVEAGKSPQLAVEACVEAIEQTLPEFLRTSRENISQPAHPSGDAFFQGGNGELTDAEAETLAQRQLARSGLLRGQRVKVVD